MGSGIAFQKINIHFIIGVLFFIFLCNYLLQNLGYSNTFTRNYLDDLLAMPIILYIAQVMMRIVYKNKGMKLDVTMHLYGFALVSIAFEWILPKYFDHLTSDYWDIACYAIGTLAFYLLNQATDNPRS